MSHHHRKRSKIKSLVYIFLSFMLAFALFLLSVCMVLRFTVFSNDFMLNTMADVGYYEMVKDELSEKLKNLGHASGLTDEFVDDFVKGIDMIEVERDYINAFYSGSETLVNTNHFKQKMLAALDKFIEDNNIDRSKASEKNLSYLVDNASDIYVAHVSVPFFSVIGNYIAKTTGPLRIAEIFLALFALGISAIIWFTNEYKHRRFRYLCYGLSGAALTTAIIPSFVFISGIISQVNLGSRSLYMLFVSYGNSFFMHFWIFVVMWLFLAVLSFAMFYIRYKKATSNQ